MSISPFMTSDQSRRRRELARRRRRRRRAIGAGLLALAIAAIVVAVVVLSKPSGHGGPATPVFWNMDKVDHADNLLKEMGVK